MPMVMDRGIPCIDPFNGGRYLSYENCSGFAREAGCGILSTSAREAHIKAHAQDLQSFPVQCRVTAGQIS
jgi:hypothetical protein